MTPSEIKPGMKFNHWEVIKFDHKNEHRIWYFLCRCDVCGTIRPVRGSSLVSGYSVACSKECADSLLGMTFGRWHVEKVDLSKKGYYICRCECGTVRSVCKTSLKAGTTKSCGCLKSEIIKQGYREQAEDHIGEKYGKLTILGCKVKVNARKESRYWYDCQCECGNTCEVLGSRLFDGTTTSCGCINSKANEMMAKILTKYQIPFQREYRFDDCRDKNPLPFDFAIFNREGEVIGLIENNGDQHYSARGTQWNTPERLIYTQKHDYMKQVFSEKAKIPLLIIPYQYFDELEKFLITSDFWKIIIKNFND